MLTKFADYCSPWKNNLFQRFKFWNRSQQEEESVNQFVTELKRMIKNCKYTESTGTMVRDRLVLGIQDAKVQSQLPRNDVNKLTLEKALSYCRSAEVTESQLKEIRVQSTENKVLAVSKSSKQPYGTHFNCSKCGGRHGLKQSPAFGKICFVCDGGNHLAEMCSRRTRKVHTVAASVVPLDNCPQDARNDERVDTKLFVGELEISTVD